MKTFIIPVFTLIFLTACPSQQNDLADYMKIEHPNGISLLIPRNWTAHQDSSGFRITTLDSQFIRVPEEVNINMNTKERKPEGEWPLTRKIENRIIYYKTEISAGGSSGTTYVLTAWEAIPNGYIWIEQYTQSEAPASPDFSFAWNIMTSLKLQKKD